MPAIPLPPRLNNNNLNNNLNDSFPALGPVVAGAMPVDSNFVLNSRKRLHHVLCLGNEVTEDEKERFQKHLHIVEHQHLGNQGYYYYTYYY